MRNAARQCIKPFLLVLSLSIAISMFSGAVIAQSPLDTLQDKYGFQASNKGTFTQKKLLTGFPFPLESTGRYEFSPSNELQWHILTPVESTLFIGDAEIVHIDQGKELMRLNVTEQPMLGLISQSFLAMFSGQWGSLAEYFDADVNLQEHAWELTLLPKTAAVKTFSQSIVLRGAETLQSFEMLERNGDKTIIEFRALQEGAAQTKAQTTDEDNATFEAQP